MIYIQQHVDWSIVKLPNQVHRKAIDIYVCTSLDFFNLRFCCIMLCCLPGSRCLFLKQLTHDWGVDRVKDMELHALDIVSWWFSEGWKHSWNLSQKPIKGQGKQWLEHAAVVYFNLFDYYWNTRWWLVWNLFYFQPIWGRFPFWLIFFKWVETTNQNI